MSTRDGARSIAYVVGLFALLAVAWNGFASRFDPAPDALRRTDAVFDRAARDLAITLDELPPPERPRVALYGGSQIARAIRHDRRATDLTPHRLAEALRRRGVEVEIADLSDDGQQLIEALIVDAATRDVSRPSAIVVGVSLFTMTRTGVRETLLEDIDAAMVAARIRAALPPDADPAVREAMLAWKTDLPAPLPDREPTLQERLDAAIGAWLDRHVAAYANRQAIYRDGIDLPLRLAIQRWQRERAGQTISSSYAIGPAYAPSLLALDTMQRAAAAAGIPFLVVVLPFDHERPPVPFDAATQARVVADVAAIAERAGVPLLDLGDALPSARFGTYEDGSPDNLHYDAAGHAIVAERIAARLAPLLAGAR
jgi:hypothetical protein